MSYLRFDKTLMINLEESLPREILRTNKSGAYHCTTIVDCNTRKYHGLLVIPVPNLDDENHVLLSSLDETVIQHGAEFNLGLHKYQGDHFSPNGHKYIREFDCEHIPATTYRVGGVILRKEKIFVHHENRILIRYTLVDAHSATTLRFRPFLAFRSVREYTHENPQANRDYQLVENGVMLDGEINGELNEENKFLDINYGLKKCKFYKFFQGISEREAYEQICSGKFFYPYGREEELSVLVKDCKTVYERDSKGYYQPVYLFSCEINGEESEIKNPILQ